MADEDDQEIERDETPAERADRNFDDILQELRVTQTGVQVLFSVLLTIPFSQRFEKVTAFQKDVYFLALLLAAATAVMLVAPVSTHRLLFRTGQKPWVVKVAAVYAVVGTVLLLLTIAAVLLFVSDVLFASTLAVAIAVLFGVSTGVLWFVPPLLRRRR
jgi:Kef-type K+ transport system membrane component KefB